jgi:protein-arginine kinase activator protein McsA
MNILLDSECPRCQHAATLELSAGAAEHDAQQLDIIVKCHFCNATFNDFISIDEMVAIDE